MCQSGDLHIFGTLNDPSFGDDIHRNVSTCPDPTQGVTWFYHWKVHQDWLLKQRNQPWKKAWTLQWRDLKLFMLFWGVRFLKNEQMVLFLGENKNTQLWIHPAPTPACYEFEIRLSSTWSSIKFHPVISWYFAGHITTDFPQKVADVSGNRNPPGEGEIIFHLARLYIVTRRSWKFWIPSLYEKHGILKNSCCGVVLLPLLSGCQTLCVMPGKLLGLPEDSQCFDEVLCLKWWEILGYCLFREQKDGDLFQQTLQLTLGMQSPCQMMNGVYSHLLRKVFRFHHHF